jgi:hypothetical protein
MEAVLGGQAAKASFGTARRSTQDRSATSAPASIREPASRSFAAPAKGIGQAST